MAYSVTYDNKEYQVEIKVLSQRQAATRHSPEEDAELEITEGLLIDEERDTVILLDEDDLWMMMQNDKFMEALYEVMDQEAEEQRNSSIY